jgi:hypothetical protein
MASGDDAKDANRTDLRLNCFPHHGQPCPKLRVARTPIELDVPRDVMLSSLRALNRSCMGDDALVPSAQASISSALVEPSARIGDGGVSTKQVGRNDGKQPTYQDE